MLNYKRFTRMLVISLIVVCLLPLSNVKAQQLSQDQISDIKEILAEKFPPEGTTFSGEALANWENVTFHLPTLELNLTSSSLNEGLVGGSVVYSTAGNKQYFPLLISSLPPQFDGGKYACGLLSYYKQLHTVHVSLAQVKNLEQPLLTPVAQLVQQDGSLLLTLQGGKIGVQCTIPSSPPPRES